MPIFRVARALLLLFLCAIGSIVFARAEETPSTSTVTTAAADGLVIYGETFFGGLGPDAPLILLFHQGGSNGRGEYADIVPWLNAAGYRAIAWDQRSGGGLYGRENRTAAQLPEGTDLSYCDAYPDLEAALAYVTAQGLADKAVVWGSSYSGSLIFRLAAEQPDRIAGVIGFSPASGGPMLECRARLWAEDITAPVFVLRPGSEMQSPSVQQQRDIVTGIGAAFRVEENGIHGSSMLVDGRTGHDMSAARAAVLDWLAGIHPRPR